MEVTKKVSLDLEGLDGNAFFLIMAFRKQAKLEGWEQKEIDEVVEEAQNDDYDHLLQTFVKHTE